VVRYLGEGGARREEDERRVLEVSRGGVPPGLSMSWGSAGLRIPPLPPSSFPPDSCKIIHIDYRIEVSNATCFSKVFIFHYHWMNLSFKLLFYQIIDKQNRY
jgi:hypothetical protein